MEEEYSERIKTYTLGELQDIEQNIDRVKFPDRYQIILNELIRRESITVTASPEQNNDNIAPIGNAGFWIRVWAKIVDGLVFFLISLPLIFLWYKSNSKNMSLIFTISSTFLYLTYTVYFHGRWGKTLGKMSAKIRVVLVNGSPIKWKNAMLRSSVDFGFAIIGLIGTIFAVSLISANDYSSLTFIKRASEMNSFQPTYFRYVSYAAMIWFYVDVIVVLFNKKKRAIHDFIAGTIVVHESSLHNEEI